MGGNSGISAAFQTIYQAPPAAAETERRLSAQGVDLYTTGKGLDQMLERADGVLHDNIAVAAPGIGNYYGNAAFFTKSSVTMDQAFANVEARQNDDIENGLNSANNNSLEANLEAVEDDVGAPERGRADGTAEHR